LERLEVNIADTSKEFPYLSQRRELGYVPIDHHPQIIDPKALVQTPLQLESRTSGTGAEIEHEHHHRHRTEHTHAVARDGQYLSAARQGMTRNAFVRTAIEENS
jgi:hypothetical protein